MSDIVRGAGGQLETLAERNYRRERTRVYADAALSPATRKAYRQAWEAFCAWCQPRSVSALPACPSDVADYVAWMADQGRRVSTINRSLVAVGHAHQAAGLPSPCKSPEVSLAARGIRRQVGLRVKKKKAAVLDILERMVEVTPTDLRGLRDRALLLLGFTAALRRSELVGLDVEDLEFDDRGLSILLRTSKTDQEGAGQYVGVFEEDGAPAAIREWMKAANVASGPLFRGVDRWGHVLPDRMDGKTVWRVVKAACAAAGMDPALFGAHSLRSGFVTEAGRQGKREDETMAQTRHKHIPTYRSYRQRDSVFDHNASKGITKGLRYEHDD